MRAAIVTSTVVATMLVLQGCGNSSTTATTSGAPGQSTNTTSTGTTTMTTTSSESFLCEANVGKSCNSSMTDLNFSRDIVSAAACCTFCLSQKGCMAWTWDNRTGPSLHFCYLHADCTLVTG